MSTEGIGRSNLPLMPGSPSPAGDAAPVRPGSSNPPPDAGLPAPFAGRPAQADSAPAASLQPRIGLGKLQPAVPASAAVARPDVATATVAVLRLAAQGTMGLRKAHAAGTLESAAGVAFKGLAALAEMQRREAR